MTGVLFAAGLALCLNVFACLAMSTVGGVIRTSAWAVGRARRGPGTAYFGLTSAVAYHDDKIIYEESLGAPLSPLIAFRADCTTSSTSSLDMRNGPGFICMGIAVFLKGSSVFAHLALRVSNGDGVVREPSVHPKKSAAKGMARSACPFAPVHIDVEGN
ncbi:hypothetical protein SO694_00151060 [Aureococcus anophagefferens]|uniref:Uncharacterized protein n=1 Tax=Aureococcus anophagefferens TaxID=44056 RepID=A0ABR1GF15_AURAN